MNDLSYITSSHPAYIENLYKDFLKNPESVDVDMRKFFEGFRFCPFKCKWKRKIERCRCCCQANASRPA